MLQASHNWKLITLYLCTLHMILKLPRMAIVEIIFLLRFNQWESKRKLQRTLFSLEI